MQFNGSLFHLKITGNTVGKLVRDRRSWTLKSEM